MRRISVGVVVAMMMTGALLAQAPVAGTGWASGPVQHLMTPEEIKEWKASPSNEAAQAFIDLFWAKRDPTPATPLNELREQFDARVAAADRYFSTVGTIGSMSDRGRAFILLGSPHRVTSRGEAPRAVQIPITTAVDDWDGSVPPPRVEPAKLTWYYAYDKKPKFIKRISFEILFIDDRGGGQFEFAKTPTLNPEHLLHQAVQAYIVSPHLTQPLFAGGTVPARGSEPISAFGSADLKAAYDRFRDEGQTSIGSAHLTWGEYVTPQGEDFVPVSLYVPAGSGIAAGTKLTFFGAVENVAGELVEVVEEEATLMASGRDAYVDKSLRLAPGRYTATFGLAENGRVLAMTKTAMTIRDLNPSENAVSQLILSNHAYALPNAQQRTDPYSFGGFKVVPKGDSLFSTKDELWCFLEMRNPGVGATGAAKVMVKLDIEGQSEGRKAVRLDFPIKEVEAQALKDVKNHYAVAQAVPLSDFSPGVYTVKMRIIDPVLETSYEVQKRFRVRNP